MKIPYSWLKEYIDLNMPLDELARLLTMLGLEVDEVHVIGMPIPQTEKHEFKFTGFSWSPEKIVVAQIDEVMPHPNADRLTLCRLKDGTQDHVVLTGAPNLFEYKGKGPLPKPLKVAYAKEGAQIYDGHAEGLVLTTLKRAKIRGVESYSMVCSEKELGISDEHEGIMILAEDAPTGMPLVDYLGDAVFEISILPNMIRNACVVGVARELAAALNQPLRKPQPTYKASGAPVEGQAFIQITDPNLNPRFVLGMVRGTTPQPSPEWVQRRLRLAGMRPINSIVDATNYVMLETGEPLHAFDYDVLVQRAGGKAPTIITRPAVPGEKLTTLDNVERNLEPYMILVTDTAGPLSLAGVMGGLESEVTESTRTVLLEAASWNYINIRRTGTTLHLSSEAGYRFGRGVHPELAPWAGQLCLERIAEWSGGEIAAGLIDAYPLPAEERVVTISPAAVRRCLGIDLALTEIADLLTRLEFTCSISGGAVQAHAPAHRLDIGEGVVGQADVLEEIARMYHYDRIPETRIDDIQPPLHRNRNQQLEESVANTLVSLGLQEAINYRLTSPEREARLLPPEAPQEDLLYTRLANPISPERGVMRRNLVSSLMETLERNARLRERLAFFEIGPIFLPEEGELLPEEELRLGIVLMGKRSLSAWDQASSPWLDFYDLKGILEALVEEMHLPAISFVPAQQASYHPGKCAALMSAETCLGVFGELHPQVRARFDLGSTAAPVLAADINLAALLSVVPPRFDLEAVPVFPPIKEDIAVIVDETMPAEQVAALIRQTGGKLLSEVRLFDIFRSEQIGAGKKSLAYNLTYQSAERTLTDTDATQLRSKIIKRLEQALGAKLRS